MLVRTVAREQKNRGHSVAVVVRKDTPLCKALEEDKIQTIVYGSGIGGFLFPLKVRSYVRKNRVDVVHFHQLKAMRRILPLLPGGESRPRYVFTEHSPRPQPIISSFNTYVLNLVDTIIAVSKDQKECVAKSLGVKVDRIRVVYNGVDLTKFSAVSGKIEKQELRMQLRLPDSKIIVSCIGRITSDKGQDIFVQAAELVIKTLPETLFEVGGDMENIAPGNKVYVESLKQMQQESSSRERIKFRGFIEDVSTYFKAVDMVIVPSKIEPFGLVAAEAMASGIPVIVSNAGALPEVVGNCGIVVEERTPRLFQKLS